MRKQVFSRASARPAGRRGLACARFFFLMLFTALTAGRAAAQVNHVVISQVNGAGNVSGATANYTADYVELFNPTGADVNIGGWTIRYASATGANYSGTLTLRPGTIIGAGHYYLVTFAASNGMGGTDAFPYTPDAAGSFDISGSTTAGGRIALIKSSATVAPTDLTHADLVDMVGWGTAGSSEGGAAAPAHPPAGSSLLRKNGGCTDTDNNSADWEVSPKNARSSQAPANYCYPTALHLSTPADVTAGTPFSLTVTTRNSGGNAMNVTAATQITVTHSGGGSLGGSTTATIAAGSSSVTLSGLTLSAAGTATLTVAASLSGSNVSYTTGSFTVTGAGTAATDYFRSAGGTADWSSAASWESSANGTDWVASSLAPTSAAAGITIRSGHTITVSSAATMPAVTVETGGALLVNHAQALATGSFTVASGGSLRFGNSQSIGSLSVSGSGQVIVDAGVSLSISGTADLYAATSFSGSGTVALGAGATLRLNPGAGTGNTNSFTWNAAATLRYADGGAFTLGASDTYWTNSNYPRNVVVGSGGLTLNAARSAASSLELNGPLTLNANLMLGGASLVTLNSGGSVGGSGSLQYNGSSTALVYNAGNVQAGNEWGSAFNAYPASITLLGGGTVTLPGAREAVSIALTDGTLSVGTNTLYVAGDITRGSGTLSIGNGHLLFRGSGLQTVAAGTFSSIRSIAVYGSGTVQLNDNIAVQSSVSLVNGLLDLNGHSLTFGFGATLSRSGGSISGTPAYGTFNTVVYTNSSPLSTGPELPPSLDNLTLNSSAKVTLASDVTVTGNFTLTTGVLDIGAHNFTVSSGGIFGGSAASYVQTSGSGSATFRYVPSTARLLPVGNGSYNPVRVSSGTGNLLDWTVSVSDEAPTGPGGPAGDAVARIWNLTPSQNPVPNGGATVTFQYSDATDVGATFSKNRAVKAWHHNGTKWMGVSAAIQPSGTPGGTRTVTVTGLTEFSPYALSNFDAPLPVTLLRFTGKRTNNSNELKWTTATEQNNRGFAIERSIDGVNFTQVAFVGSRAAAGNSTSDLHYSFNETISAGSKWFYRLKQEDIDGRSRYSSVVLLKGEKSGVITLDGIYPNPVKGATSIRLQASAQGGNVVLQLTDMQGRVVRQQSVLTEAGASTTVTLDLTSLAAGPYHLKAIAAGGEVSEVVTVLKQ